MRSHEGDGLPAHWFQILLALASEDCHGAAIVRAVLDQTDGRMRLWPVKLYSSLERLVAAGTIAECPAPATESERRRYYQITTAGRRVLAAEAKGLAHTARLARTRLARSRP